MKQNILWLDILFHVGLISWIIGDVSTCSSTPKKRDFSNFLPETRKHIFSQQYNSQEKHPIALDLIFYFYFIMATVLSNKTPKAKVS